MTLSDDFFQIDSDYDCTLFQEDYETNEKVKEWNQMVKELKKIKMNVDIWIHWKYQ